MTIIATTGFIAHVILDAKDGTTYVNTLNDPTFHNWLKRYKHYESENKIMDKDDKLVAYHKRIEL